MQKEWHKEIIVNRTKRRRVPSLHPPLFHQTEKTFPFSHRPRFHSSSLSSNPTWFKILKLKEREPKERLPSLMHFHFNLFSRKKITVMVFHCCQQHDEQVAHLRSHIPKSKWGTEAPHSPANSTPHYFFLHSFTRVNLKRVFFPRCFHMARSPCCCFAIRKSGQLRSH